MVHGNTSTREQIVNDIITSIVDAFLVFLIVLGFYLNYGIYIIAIERGVTVKAQPCFIVDMTNDTFMKPICVKDHGNGYRMNLK